MDTRYRDLEDFLETKTGKTIVATNGCFDVFHVGHLQLLEMARSLGDVLIVGLNSDTSIKILKGPNRPINTQTNRSRVLQSLRVVDFVQIFDSPTCEDFLSACHPHIYVKSSDRDINTLNPKEREALRSCGADIRFVPLVEGISSTVIISKL